MSPRLVALFILLSGAILADTAGPAPLVKPGEVLTPERCAAVRRAILDNFFVPSPLPPVEGTVHRRFSPVPGVRAEAVSFATEYGLRVPAILYFPDPMPAGKIPGFVVVNGHGGDKYSWYSYYTGIL